MLNVKKCESNQEILAKIFHHSKSIVELGPVKSLRKHSMAKNQNVKVKRAEEKANPNQTVGAKSGTKIKLSSKSERKLVKISSKIDLKTPNEMKKPLVLVTGAKKTVESFWDILKPFAGNNHAKDLIIQYITSTKLSEHMNMEYGDIIKISVAKYLLESGLRPGDILKTKKVPEEKKENDSSKDKEEKSKQSESSTDKKSRNELSTLLLNLSDPVLSSRCGVRALKSNESIKKYNDYKIPKKVEETYSYLSSYVSKSLFIKMFRPQIYFDLETKDENGRTKVGRLVFQLFTEACPALVMEFVRNCASNQYQIFNVQNFFDNIWIECSMKLEKSLWTEKKRVPRMLNCVDHASSLGVLSFPVSCLRELASRKSFQFVISVSPLKTSSQRVTFGILHHGEWFLRHLQKFRKCSGPLSKHVRIVKCGALGYI